METINELSLKTDAELEQMVKAIESRSAKLQTKDGITQSEMWMLKMFKYLALSGYKVPAEDKMAMAKVWVSQLRDYIALYGFKVIEEAVERYVIEDTSSYRQIPNTGQLIAIIKTTGKNPIAEIGRRKQAEREAALEREWRSCEKVLTDEERAEYMAKYPNIKTVLARIGC